MGSLRSRGGGRDLREELAALLLIGDQKLVRRYDRRGRWSPDRRCSRKRESSTRTRRSPTAWRPTTARRPTTGTRTPESPHTLIGCLQGAIYLGAHSLIKEWSGSCCKVNQWLRPGADRLRRSSAAVCSKVRVPVSSRPILRREVVQLRYRGKVLTNFYTGKLPPGGEAS